MAKHKRMFEGDDGWTEWIYPTPKKYQMACCDCGLTHTVQFEVRPVEKNLGNGYTRYGKAMSDKKVRVSFRVRRDNRATAQVRRHRKADCSALTRGPLPLYHWSPVSRRDGILKRGLVVGSKHSVHTPGWRAGYVCFSDSPSFAWAYSAGTTKEAGEWDLWMTWSTHAGRLERRKDLPGQPTEYRGRKGIPKRHLWRVGSRHHEPRKR